MHDFRKKQPFAAGCAISKDCGNISDTVANIETIRDNIEGQTEVVDKVQNTFTDFRALAEKTKASVNDIEHLVGDMHESNHYVVQAVEKIRNISTNTAELTDKAADSLDEQLHGIRNVSERIDALSQVSTKDGTGNDKIQVGIKCSKKALSHSPP